MKMKISDAARRLGVSPKTLREWERSGKVAAAERTAGGHRRFEVATEGGPAPAGESCVIYGRVSTRGQSEDLVRQIARLEERAASDGLTVWKVYSDIASGLNGDRRGLVAMIRDVCKGRFATVLVTHRDRLARFGVRPIVEFFATHGVRVVYAEASDVTDVSTELAEDVLAVLTSFSGKLYGRRRARNKKSESTLH